MRLELRLLGIKITFSFWFFGVVALFALSGREQMVLYIALPVAIHELGHLLMMTLCRVRLREIAFTPVSIRIQTAGASLSRYRELLVALGGIVANLLAAFCLKRFTFQSMRAMLMVASHLAVALFNLLPIGNLDGGQVMQILCSGILEPSSVQRISTLVSVAALIPLSALAGYLLLRGEGNFTLALTCLYLIATVILRDK